MHVLVPRTAGFSHVSCLAEQAKILMDEQENNLGKKVLNERWLAGTRAPVRATVPRRRVVRARVGVLACVSHQGGGGGRAFFDDEL